MSQTINLNSEYNFLFNSFSTEDIESITDDLSLIRDNYYFLYVVDTYDIVENYLPYTEIEIFSKKNRNQEAQKFICYDYFFGGLNKTSTILMDEYKIELLAAKNKLTKHLKEAKFVIRNLESLKRDTDDFFSNPKLTEEFFKNHFEVILLLLILNDKTNSILEEFFSFLKSRLLISEVKTSKPEDSELVTSIFESCRSTKSAIDIFEIYIEENKAQLLSIKSNKDRHIFLENTFRDCQVIDRITRINKVLADHALKYRVIYLSTANKTKELFKVLKKLSPVNNEEKNTFSKTCHRNIYQFFLHDKIKNEFSDDIEKGIEILRSIQLIINKTSNNSFLNETLQLINDANFSRIIKFLSNEKSSIIDNHFYLGVYEKYKKTFDLDSSELNKPLDRNEIIKIIREVDKNKSHYKSNIFNLDFTLSQLNQTYDVIETFYNIDDYELQYRFGNDIIRNPYQHLPYLLLTDRGFNSALKTKLYTFLNLSIELNNKTKNNSKESLKDLINELTKLDINNQENRLLKSLILTYINFVAQPKERRKINSSESKNFSYNEEEFILDFEKQYGIIRYQLAKVDENKTRVNSKLEFIHEDSNLLKEIAYILIWLYRRQNNEGIGIKKGLELIKLGSNDPRIFQGLGLCYISISYKLLKDKHQHDVNQISKNLDLSLHYLRLAKEGFKVLINTHDKSDNLSLIVKNYIAILNSIADLSIRKYEINFDRVHLDNTLLDLSRSNINEIKELFDVLNLLYDNYPTYSATEMELEYYEALYHFELGQINKAHQKIINASTRIFILKKLLDENLYVDEFFLKKELLVNKLLSTIVSKY